MGLFAVKKNLEKSGHFINIRKIEMFIIQFNLIIYYSE